MKVKRKVSFAIAVAMILCLFSSFGVYAETPHLAGQGEVLYQTDFSDASTNWQEYRASNNPAAWEYDPAGKVYSIPTGNGNKSVYEGQTFDNFVLEADLIVNRQVPNGTDASSAQAALIFRVSDPFGPHGDGYNGYCVNIDAHNNQIMMGKVTNGTTWTELIKKKMNIEYGQSYHVTVAVDGDHIVVYVDYDGERYAKLDITDSSHSEGYVGVRNWLSSASFSNLKVSAYEEPKVDGPSYTNTVVDIGADPDVLYHEGTYYLYPTTPGSDSFNAGIKVYTSTDLVNWTDKGLALKAEEVRGSFNFWAPDVIERDGKFYMYYTAEEHIGVAVADSPLGPFEQEEQVFMHENTKEIDAHVYRDDDGQYYFYFVRFNSGNRIWGAKLNDDMKSIDESTVVELLVATEPWETNMANIIEGPYMLKKDGLYYLTYSASHFQSRLYGAGYAVSDNPLGPYIKYENNPIMQSNDLVRGAGHHGIAWSPDGEEMFMVYHQHQSTTATEPRRVGIDRMQFTTDEKGKTVLEVNGPTVTPQPVPSGAVDVDNLISFQNPDAATEVEHGTPVEEWDLPETVEIVTSKSPVGAPYEAAIAWDAPDYDPNEIGEQEIVLTGTVVLPVVNGAQVANLGEKSLEVHASVRIKEAPGGGEDIPVESIDLNAGSLNMLRIGDTLELNPIIVPENATDKTVTYTSNNPAAASVDENGVVTGHKTGTAMITATSSSGKVSKTTVRVTY